jgi:hypothetical protein
VIYVGSIRHRETIYDGEHEAIIDRQMFDEVQRFLKEQTPTRRNSRNQQDGHLLTGIFLDAAGDKLRAVHANKKGVRYRYYVSSKLVEGRRKDADGWRLPAREVDSLVEHRLTQILHDHAQLTDWVQKSHPTANLAAALDRCELIITGLKSDKAENRRTLVHKLVRRVVLQPGTLTLEFDSSAIVSELSPEAALSTKHEDTVVRIDCPISMRRRGVEMRMVVTNGVDRHRDPDPALTHLVLRAHRYLAILNDGKGKTLSDVAAMEAVELSEVSRILPLAFIAPSIVESVLAGTQPVSLTAQRLLRLPDLPASWQQQLGLLA